MSVHIAIRVGELSLEFSSPEGGYREAYSPSPQATIHQLDELYRKAKRALEALYPDPAKPVNVYIEHRGQNASP